MNQTSQRILHTGKFLTLIKDGHWEYIDRVHGIGVTLIIGVTTEQKVLLVEQYRIPVHTRTIELPAGIIGDEPGLPERIVCRCRPSRTVGGNWLCRRVP